jgi:flagellar protein FliO/FliZ
VASEISLLKPILGLIFFFILMGAVVWLLKNLQHKKAFFGSKSIRIADSLSIGAREKLAIVEVERKRVLIGITPTHISYLSELDPITGSAEELGRSESIRNEKSDASANKLQTFLSLMQQRTK